MKKPSPEWWAAGFVSLLPAQLGSQEVARCSTKVVLTPRPAYSPMGSGYHISNTPKNQEFLEPEGGLGAMYLKTVLISQPLVARVQQSGCTA